MTVRIIGATELDVEDDYLSYLAYFPEIAGGRPESAGRRPDNEWSEERRVTMPVRRPSLTRWPANRHWCLCGVAGVRGLGVEDGRVGAAFLAQDRPDLRDRLRAPRAQP